MLVEASSPIRPTTPTVGAVDVRLKALRRFATAITVLNLLGHFWLGFEQSWAHPLAALATAYSLEILLEWLEAQRQGRPPRYRGGWVTKIDFLLSAHISGLAVAMLLYANDRLAPVAFAAAVAIGSKYLFRAPVGQGSRHYFNPSNLGITATLVCFPAVGMAAPYQFTENLGAVGDIALPLLIITSGSLLNTLLTKRMPLIAAWVGCFALQALLRPLLFGTADGAPLVPMTGVAFILFTFYMVTDPATTPSSTKGQILFGAAVAFTYGALISLHIIFDLFFALTLTCLGRGLALYVTHWLAERKHAFGLSSLGAQQRVES